MAATESRNEIRLWRAARNGKEDEITRLIEAKANVNYTQQDCNSTALMKAAQKGHLGCARILVDRHANLNLRNNSGATALLHAAQHKHMQMMKFLLEHGADVHLADNGGWTALHEATNSGSVEAVALLLQNKADVNARNRHGNTPLHLSVLDPQRANPEVVSALLKHRADPALENWEGQTAHELAAAEHPRCARLMEARMAANSTTNEAKQIRYRAEHA